MFGVWCLVGLVLGVMGEDVLYSAFFKEDEYKWYVQLGDGGIAKGYYVVMLNRTGWNTLHIETDGTYSDEFQSYGAGFLEGYLTREEIWNTWLVFSSRSPFNHSITDFILNQDKWVRSMANTSQSEGYWHQVLLVLYQLDGLLDGYSQYSPPEKQISYTEFLYMVLSAELSDIRTFVNMRAREASGEPVGEIADPPGPPLGFHCSVLIKVSSDGLNLISSHDTWDRYSTMLRIYKYYHFAFNDPTTKVHKMAFSSYPANIQSVDDYYILGSQLVVSETTNEVTIFTFSFHNLSRCLTNHSCWSTCQR
eukprot:TRINITY_DN1478_c0_g2_i4.p1 TRINITY_DN1478_c0_g2~~TRINITY_DN1478_c0_g2_i4.p1  ORF type:complete len:307 (+),score=43.97 TRINITY_DN1478_c0_g2_i4:41-961(+)